MFDHNLSKRLIQQIELYRKYKGKVDDKTLEEIMQNRGLKIEKTNIGDIAA
jgi:putative component of toxin-antitoxin plasmid stabilization module